MKRRSLLVAASAAGVLLSTGTALGPAGAAKQAAPVPVRFVLEPSWLPAGYSATGGGWVAPAGGLHVYPEAGANASVFTVGSGKQQNTPVLFTLSYYGFRNPESKNIRLIASKEVSPSTDGNDKGTLRLDGRSVIMTSHTEGVFHNIVTTASWVERGDTVFVTTEGLTTAETSRFITGLVEHKPPRK
jgi:hypothetical protein